MQAHLLQKHIQRRYFGRVAGCCNHGSCSQYLCDVASQCVAPTQMPRHETDGKAPLRIKYHNCRVHTFMFQEWSHCADGNATGADEYMPLPPGVVCGKGCAQIFKRDNVTNSPRQRNALRSKNTPCIIAPGPTLAQIERQRQSRTA